MLTIVVVVPAPSPRQRVAADHPHYKWVALSNTTLGILISTINSSIVIISLPAIFKASGSIPSRRATSATCCG